jgi:hypothetical protein
MTASMEDVAASKLEQKGGVAILKGRANAENFFHWNECQSIINSSVCSNSVNWLINPVTIIKA